MAPLTEFTLFADLPAELRAMIWGFVPQPARVVGLVPPAAVWYNQVLGSRRPSVLRSPESHQQDLDSFQAYHFRYVVQPRDQAIFPPLHVNREARAAWLPRFFQPYRRRQVHVSGGEEDGHSHYNLQFDMPLISYDKDIFTVFDAWDSNIFASSAIDPPGPNVDIWGYIDPFLGLDRTHIRHVALCEIPDELELAIFTLDINRLPALRAISILTLGPDVFHQKLPPLKGTENNTPFPPLEMPAVDVQNVDCELRDVVPRVVESNHFLNETRPRHAIALSPNIRPLPRYTAFTMALLWHARMVSWNAEHDIQAITLAWWDFEKYLFRGPEDAKCPLPLQGCGVQGHSREEMLQWKPEFDVNHKLLCAREWVETLEKLGVFDKS